MITVFGSVNVDLVCRVSRSPHPGETVRSPRIALVFWQGTDDLRGNNLYRQWFLAHHAPTRTRARACTADRS